jgi:hypothetical protein
MTLLSATDDNLAGLAGHPIRALNLIRSKGITDTGLLELAGLSISSLKLIGCDLVSDVGIESIADLPLKVLHIGSLSPHGCSRITDMGILYLLNSCLTDLTLMSCINVTDESLVYIGCISTLITLGISGCTRISDHGFANLVPLKKLKSLDLRSCIITDDALGYLSRLSLRDINISWCPSITNAGVAKLNVANVIVAIGCPHITPSNGQPRVMNNTSNEEFERNVKTQS